MNINIDDIEDVKQYFEEFKQCFESGRKEDARIMLEKLLEELEKNTEVKRAGAIDKRDNISISSAGKGEGDVYISLNHVMEYYIYAYYYQPTAEVKCTELPYGEYYRTYGELCMQLEKYNAAQDAYKKAIEWNPVDLDSILGLAESYKYINKLDRYLEVTKQAYRYSCTRATMARYYRNMGFYYLSKYNTELARACYVYSNIYYHTDNADAELQYLESALNDETPKLEIKDMQKMFDENGIEPGPESDTIGIIYRVGELMMNDGDNKLARDCFSIVHDITQEAALEQLLEALE